MEKRFTKNWGSLVLIFTFIIIIIVCLSMLYYHQVLLRYFQYYPTINGLILLVFIIGITAAIRDALHLKREEGAQNQLFERFTQPLYHDKEKGVKLEGVREAKITERVRSLLSMEGSTLPSDADSATAGIFEEMDGRGQVTRYIAGILVFLGLLGTFIGLLMTIEGVRDVIANISIETEDVGDFLVQLRSGLEEPLGGMSIAFSTSLFGLATSILIGFLHLLLTVGKGKHFGKVEVFMNLYLVPSERKKREVFPARAALPILEPVPSGSSLESSLLYMKASQEVLGENMEKLSSLIKRSAETTHSVVSTFEHFKGLMDNTNKLLASIEHHQLAQREAMHAIAVEGRKEKEQYLAALESLKGLEEKSERLLKTLSSEHAMSRDHSEENVGHIRKEIEILNKTLTAALLDFGKLASSFKEEIASRNEKKEARDRETGLSERNGIREISPEDFDKNGKDLS